MAKPLVHSEFGYGLDRPGKCVLDTALGVNGALHGALEGLLGWDESQRIAAAAHLGDARLLVRPEPWLLRQVVEAEADGEPAASCEMAEGAGSWTEC